MKIWKKKKLFKGKQLLLKEIPFLKTPQGSSLFIETNECIKKKAAFYVRDANHLKVGTAGVQRFLR